MASQRHASRTNSLDLYTQTLILLLGKGYIGNKSGMKIYPHSTTCVAGLVTLKIDVLMLMERRQQSDRKKSVISMGLGWLGIEF